MPSLQCISLHSLCNFFHHISNCAVQLSSKCHANPPPNSRWTQGSRAHTLQMCGLLSVVLTYLRVHRPWAYTLDSAQDCAQSEVAWRVRTCCSMVATTSAAVTLPKIWSLAPTFFFTMNLPMVASAVAMACALAFTSAFLRSSAWMLRWICLQARQSYPCQKICLQSRK